MFFGVVENVGRSDGRTRLAESNGVGIDQTQTMRAEIAHRACCGSDVQRIARADENDHEIVEFRKQRQEYILKAQRA